MNFTNGGALTVAAGWPRPATFDGFTNQGSGTITVGAGEPRSTRPTSRSYGVLNLCPARRPRPPC